MSAGEGYVAAHLGTAAPRAVGDTFATMPGSERPTVDTAAPGQRAASIAAGWCGRELGAPYAAAVWQLLADAARLGLMRHGKPEAWAAGAIVLVASANGLVHPGGESVSAQLVADDLGISLGALASTERELAGVLNLAHYRYRLPHSANGEENTDSSGGYTIDPFAYRRPRRSS